MTGETHVLESPPTGAAADWTIPQDWAHYTQEDHRTWDTLFARQARLLPGRASDASLRGLDVLTLSKPGIPDFEALSERLMKLTSSEESRFGKGCGVTCRSRWSTFPKKKK